MAECAISPNLVIYIEIADTFQGLSSMVTWIGFQGQIPQEHPGLGATNFFV